MSEEAGYLRMGLAKLSCGHSDQLRDRLDTGRVPKNYILLLTKTPAATLVSVRNNGNPSSWWAGVGRRVAHIVARPSPSSTGSLCSTASSHRGEVGEGLLISKWW